MRQLQQSNQKRSETSALNQLLRFFAKSHKTVSAGDLPSGDCMLETDDEATRCGGYNDAFVVQYWTSYNPRH